MSAVANDTAEGGTFLFAVGGRSRGNTVGFVDRFSFAKNSWSHAPRMKEPRGSLGVAASSEGILFALAGSGVDSNLSTCEYLDLRQPEEEQEWISTRADFRGTSFQCIESY